MKKNLFIVLIVLICIALSGIVIVQFFWIRNAMSVKTAAFNRGVNEALNRTVARLEMRDNIFLISRNINMTSDDSLPDDPLLEERIDVKYHFDSLLALSDFDFPPPPPPPLEDPARYGHMEVQIQTGTNFSRYRDEIVIRNHDTTFTKVVVMPDNDSSGKVVRRSFHGKIDRKTRNLREMLDRMTLHLETDRLPVEKRVSEKMLRKFLSRAFADRGIDIPFEFAVQSLTRTDNPLPIRSKGFNLNDLSTPYRVCLFPNDIFGKPDLLLVYFPSQQVHLLKSMGFLLTASLLFTAIIVFTSILSIIIMIRQKKVSEIKSDFINNMTHEFKTPIATISIAVDSINNPRIIESPEKIKAYTQIIREENSRMNSRVEQVLQMSLLESSEFRLSTQCSDLHELIRRVAGQFSLQVQNRSGKILLHLDAPHHFALVDESHFANVLMTLVDNAVKYSPEKPEVTISTASRSGNLIISVEDKGIGMSVETQKKIFEKFFRVTTGNIHTVKGFGLGLSYAKAIVLAHKGSITVVSEPGKGSRFEISLPLSNPPDQPVTKKNNEQGHDLPPQNIAG